MIEVEHVVFKLKATEETQWAQLGLAVGTSGKRGVVQGIEVWSAKGAEAY